MTNFSHNMHVSIFVHAPAYAPVPGPICWTTCPFHVQHERVPSALSSSMQGKHQEGAPNQLGLGKDSTL